jgi:hypothetical protein
MENKRCEHCQEGEYIIRVKKFWHRLSPGIVQALIKFRRAVHENGRNSLHLYNDLKGENQLTTVEQMNWTKLRFHGLVAKAQEERHWLLTHRGVEFLNGELRIPKRVQTVLNRVIGKDDELVMVKDVIGELPVWDSKDEIKSDVASETDIDAVVAINKKKVKGKKYCSQCGEGILKFMFEDTLNKETNTMKVKRFLKCTVCTFKEEIKI